MPPVATNDQVGANFRGAIRRLNFDSNHAIAFAHHVYSLMLHAKIEMRIFAALRREKIEKIPLRHERHELAVCRNMGEVGGSKGETSKNAANPSQFLMR